MMRIKRLKFLLLQPSRASQKGSVAHRPEGVQSSDTFMVSGGGEDAATLRTASSGSRRGKMDQQGGCTMGGGI